MSALGAFCNQLVAFFEDLTETYPEERDIQVAAQALRLLKQANPRLMHKVFMENVHAKYARYILAEDEEYIIAHAREVLNSQYAEMNYAFWIFDKHWTTMTETNKQHVWKYIKSLILLAERVPAAA
jgi:hypothetical protein